VATVVGGRRSRLQRKTISEIACGAAGAYAFGPICPTVLDAGGQSCKVIHCTEKGEQPLSFGTKMCCGYWTLDGSISIWLKKEVTEIGTIALQSDQSQS